MKTKTPTDTDRINLLIDSGMNLDSSKDRIETGDRFWLIDATRGIYKGNDLRELIDRVSEEVNEREI